MNWLRIFFNKDYHFSQTCVYRFVFLFYFQINAFLKSQLADIQVFHIHYLIVR